MDALFYFFFYFFTYNDRQKYHIKHFILKNINFKPSELNILNEINTKNTKTQQMDLVPIGSGSSSKCTST